MKLLTTLLTSLLLTGCAMPDAMHSRDKEDIEQAYVFCKRAVDATPEAVRLSETFVLGKGRHNNYLDKITDDSYATDAQIPDILSYQSKLKVCRDQAVLDLHVNNSDYASLAEEYFRMDDEITADVVARRITIGEANRMVTQSEYSFSLKEYSLGE